jgi:hypothetical protein
MERVVNNIRRLDFYKGSIGMHVNFDRLPECGKVDSDRVSVRLFKPP